jgi:type IV secretion system protein TrbL
MPVTQVAFFALLINTFKEVLSTATDAIYPWVYVMTAFLVMLELGRVCYGIEVQGQKAGALATWLIRVVFLSWVISNWEYLFSTCMLQGVQMGLRMGGNRISQENFLNPGAYVQLGIEVGDVLYQQWNTSQISNALGVVFSPFVTGGYFLAWVFFVICFFLMALTIYIVQIEMAFAVPTLLVLLPFLAFGKTGWMGQGTVTFLAKQAYLFLMLALIASVSVPIAQQITLTHAPDIRQALLIDFAALALVVMFWKGPTYARNILSGVLTMGAGSVANAAVLASQTIVLGRDTLREIGRQALNTGALVVTAASGGVLTVPTIPKAPQAPHLTRTLQDSARHLHD